MKSRLTNRNYLATDSNPAPGIATQEKFVTHIYPIAGGITRPLGVGICYEWSVPPMSAMHYVWVAAGAYLHTSRDIGDQWFVQGKLNFIRGGRPIGEFHFGDAGSFFGSNLQGKATRLLTRTRGDAGGSFQPALRYQATEDFTDTYARDNLDMACVALPVSCDRIQYEIQSHFVTVPAVGSIQILTGARIVSLP